MKKDTLKSVREKVIMAVPEIVIDWQCQGCLRIYAEYINGCPNCWNDSFSIEENKKMFPKRKVVPLSRPITLEDVLVAMETNPNFGEAFIFLTMDKKIGDKKIGFFINNEREPDFYWKIRKPLKAQSEETLNFLNDII